MGNRHTTESEGVCMYSYGDHMHSATARCPFTTINMEQSTNMDHKRGGYWETKLVRVTLECTEIQRAMDG